MAFYPSNYHDCTSDNHDYPSNSHEYPSNSHEYPSNSHEYGEYYYSTPTYSASYDIVQFQNSSFSSSHYTSCYDIVPFQDSSSLNYSTSSGIVPFQDSSSLDYSTSCYDIVPFQDLSSSSNYPTDFYEIVPFQDLLSSNREANGYDIVQYQDSSYYSNYEYTKPNTFDYDPNPYNYEVYDSSITLSEVNYSVHNFAEPNYLEYNPVFHNTHYNSSDTQFLISYSNAPIVDDTEYDKYDPTPYDGGYNIAQTYGKPLQPSDQICYPRSVPNPYAIVSDNFSYASIPSPYGNPEKKTKKVTFAEPIPETEPPSGISAYGGQVENVPEKPIALSKEEEAGNTGNEPEKSMELSKLEEVKGDNCDNGEIDGDYGNCGNGPYGKPIIEYQGTYNGCGLEAMDLCEGLFGYWPCLDKKIRRECITCEQAASEENQWKAAADYLFGNSGYYPYN